MVVCPSCGSSRIRNDYKPAPFYLRLVGIRGLLCDHCNFPFRAFSPLPPKTRRPQHTKRKANIFNPAPVPALVNELAQQPQVSPLAVEKPEKIERELLPTTGGKPEMEVAALPVKKAELKLVTPAVEKLDFAVAASSAAAAPGRIVTDYIAPVRNDLRTEITRVHTQDAKEKDLQKVSVQADAKSSPHFCPECSSRNVRRRRRNFVERAVLSFGEHKAYNCRDCGASFYAKPEEKEMSQPAASIESALSESSCFNVDQRAEQKG